MSESPRVLIELIANEALIRGFLNNSSLKFDKCGVESIELVALYLETSFVLLESDSERIATSFIKINS